MTERIDDIGDGLKLIQREDMFALGTDTVLLCNFASLYTQDRVIDLGSGTGAIPLLLSARKKLMYIAALELQPELVDLCRRSIKLNNMEQMIEAIHGDIRKVQDIFPPESFDLAICNPPYMPVTGSLFNTNKSIAIARHELCCQLGDVMKAFAWLVRYGGKAALVHRPQRLGDIFCLFRENGLEPKRLQFVHPRRGMEANMALVEAEKGAQPGLRTLAPLILRGDGKN